MSHFDEASKAGFALTYDQEKLGNIRNNPSDRKVKTEKKFDPDVKMNENSEFEKYDFDSENNMIMEKVVINKFNSIVEKENEEDENYVETEKADILLNSDKLLKKGSKDLINKKALNQINRYDENVNNADNQEDAEEEVLHKNEVPIRNNAKNSSINNHINISREPSNNLRKSPPLINHPDNYKSQLHTPINKSPEVKKKSIPNNKRIPTPNDFFLNDDELVKKFNEIKQTNTFKKFVMKQENGSQVVQLTEKTDLRNVTGSNKRNELRESKKTPVKKRNTKSPSKTIDIQEICSTNQKKGNNNVEGSRNKALENENVKLRNKIKVLEQGKSFKMYEDLEEELKQVKEALKERNEELEELQIKFDKKNRENIENKSKCEALKFDNELFQNKLNDLKSKNESGDHSSLKSELKKKEEIIQKVTEENTMLKSQIESIRNESLSTKTELNKKLEKISEQQQRIFQLEQEIYEYKSRSNGESQTVKELKQNNDNLKSNLLEIKNQNELINMKHQSLADENFSMKRDLIFLEKEIKNKSEIIDRLRNELLETNKKSYSNDYYSSNYNNENRHSLSNEKNNYSNNYSNVQSNNMKNSSDFNKKTIENNKETKRGYTNSNVNTNNKKNYYNESVTNNLNILPSQVNNIKYENRVLEIENKIVKVQKERDQIQIEIEKMPEFPKTKVQILKKKNLEASIGEFNKEITKLKLDLKDINHLIKD